MTTATQTSLQYDVLAELDCIDAAKIGVTAEEGVITLMGDVTNYLDKWNAERIAKRVHGVRAVANRLEVRLRRDDERDDGDIAKAALDALMWNISVPADRIKVVVSSGWVTLNGMVDWQYQKIAAQSCVRHLKGVRGVTNEISVTPKVRASDVKVKIEEAFKRGAEVDAGKVSVEASDGRVTLRGKVRSWAEHDDAVAAAWAAPGVSNVVDGLRIEP
ncbi:MAG TPA: BON domain-containing protein [Thermoanaerobaculia bacterium]|nr:BON domain-containing protein [Thermoanaerobaculia bacterium]